MNKFVIFYAIACKNNNNLLINKAKNRPLKQQAVIYLVMGILDSTLLKHSLCNLHEAGDVGTLNVVNMTVGLCTELNALLVN